MPIWRTTDSGKIVEVGGHLIRADRFFRTPRQPLAITSAPLAPRFDLTKDDRTKLHPKAQRALRNYLRFRGRVRLKWLRVLMHWSGYSGVCYSVKVFRVLPGEGT
jgi:hypothetical protein